jgi:hypothetical protein
MSKEAFQRAWDYSINDPAALQMIERGSVWRVYEKPEGPPLSYSVEEAELEVRIIALRARRIGNIDPLWVIEARYEDGPGDWTEVTTGKMVW